MKQIFAILTVILTATCLAPAGEKMSDAEIKQKVIGYWTSPRHGYHIAPDGIIYMCPRKYATTTNRYNSLSPPVAHLPASNPEFDDDVKSNQEPL
jgi:hypothetical protein